jgi:hypothetical protein
VERLTHSAARSGQCGRRLRCRLRGRLVKQETSSSIIALSAWSLIRRKYSMTSTPSGVSWVITSISAQICTKCLRYLLAGLIPRPLPLVAGRRVCLRISYKRNAGVHVPPDPLMSF